jgi:drug/metabolite transporter (DMT)-like permease
MLLAGPMALVVARIRKTPVTWQTLRISAPAGVLFITSFITSYEALHRTSVANAVLIGSLQPVLVMLIAVPVFGERLLGVDLGWAATSIVGMVVFVLGSRHGGEANRVGDLLAVINLFLWGAYFIEMKRKRHQVAVAPFLAGVFLTGAVVVVPYAFLTHAPVGSITLADYVRVVIVTVFPGMVGHGLMTWAQRHVDVGVSALLTLGGNVLSAFGAWVVFGQALAPVQFLGGAIVLGALGMLMLGRARRVQPVGLSEAVLLE